MNRTWPLVLTGIVATAAVAGTARAGFTPAWSYVPAPLRAQLAAKLGGSLYLPARTPLFYRYRSGAAVVNGKLTVEFRNRVRVRQGVWRWTNATFIWNVQPLPSGTTCVDWQAKDKTLQLAGNKVYWSEASGTAWRCATDKQHNTFVLSVTGGGALVGDALGPVVASGLDVSGRTSPYTISIGVTPASVKRGGTVLVHGVAGDCTSGDQVTLISHAFSPARSFAGVPAVFARVGSAGRFSVKTRIPRTRAPGSYTITARCGGGNLGVAAHLTVTR